VKLYQRKKNRDGRGNIAETTKTLLKEGRFHNTKIGAGGGCQRFIDVIEETLRGWGIIDAHK